MVKEEKTEVKKEEIEEVATLIVDELPTEAIRNVLGNDGNKYFCITQKEAILEILTLLRKAEKAGLLR